MVVGLLWIICWGVVDWLTGPEISLSVFYFPGIVVVAWASGRWPGIFIAVFAALVWLTAELACRVGFSSPLIPYWNAGIRLMIFLITAVLVSEVRSRRDTEAALLEQREILKSILDSMADGVLVIGDNGKIIVFNPAAEKIFGGSSLGCMVDEWLLEVEKSIYSGSVGGAHASSALRETVTGQHEDYCEISLQKPGLAMARRLGLTGLPLLSSRRKRYGSVVIVNDMTLRREVEKQISQVIESEQRRISEELHDGVCQHLVGVAFAASLLQGDLESRGLPKQAEAAADIASLINEGIGKARGLAHGVYPVGLEDGLEMALQSLAATTCQRSGISCRFVTDGGDWKLDAVTEVHLYRIAQESVTNAVRHSGAEHIRISIGKRNTEFEMAISDDGTGMDLSGPPRGGIGHHIMNYRANLIGGKLEARSRPGKGTLILCLAPLSSRSVASEDSHE